MSKYLVTYFSASGVTAGVARNLAEATGADLYEIKPEIPYTDMDLDWRNKQSRSSVEMNDLSSRPAIADHEANIAAYDVIFIGFPIWWHIAPTVINTFLEAYDFSGKVIIPFATSGGSGLGQTLEKLKPSVPGAVEWRDGKLLDSMVSKEKLSAWVDSMDI